MKYQIRSLKLPIANIVAVAILLISLVLVFLFIGRLTDLMNAKPETVVIVAFIPIAIITFLVRNSIKTTTSIEVTDTELIVSDHNGQRTMLIRDILFIKFMSQRTLKVYKKDSKESFLNLVQAPVKDLLNEITSKGNFVRTSRTERNQTWDEYLNKDLVSEAENVKMIEIIQQKEKLSLAKIVIPVVGIVMLIPVVLFFLMSRNSTESYFFYRDGTISYGNRVLDAKQEDTKQLSHSILKDSINGKVYFYGDELSGVDPATFEHISGQFYYDKNGVYYEAGSFFSKNEIKPIDEDYDKATFKSVGRFFKDKNQVYYVIYDLVSSGTPLKKIDVKGLDIASFQTVDNQNWYLDKNKVYFSSISGKLKPAEEIDRNSFEVLSWNVAKDKNNVYYLTRFLSSEGKKSTKDDNYTILKGAHAPSFTKVNDKTYYDQNTTWTIGRGEKETYRDDVMH